MKDKQTQMWIPLYVDKWIFGSTRLELDPAERSVFIDLLALSSKDKGYIRANETTPYPPIQIAGLLNISIELFTDTINKCIKHGKIEEVAKGMYRVCKWNEYQFTRQYKHLVDKQAVMLQNCSTIGENSIEEKRIEENTTTSAVPAQSEPSKVIVWDNCKSDMQRLVAFYVRRFNPTLYEHGTKEQVTGHYKTYGRTYSQLLANAGSLDVACKAIEEFDKHYTNKGWNWNYKTLLTNFSEFVDLVMKKERGEAK